MNFINLLIEYKLYPNKKEIKEKEDKYILVFQIINYLYIHNLSDFLAIIPYFISKNLGCNYGRVGKFGFGLYGVNPPGL